MKRWAFYIVYVVLLFGGSICVGSSLSDEEGFIPVMIWITLCMVVVVIYVQRKSVHLNQSIMPGETLVAEGHVYHLLGLSPAKLVRQPGNPYRIYIADESGSRAIISVFSKLVDDHVLPPLQIVLQTEKGQVFFAPFSRFHKQHDYAQKVLDGLIADGILRAD